MFRIVLKKVKAIYQVENWNIDSAFPTLSLTSSSLEIHVLTHYAKTKFERTYMLDPWTYGYRQLSEMVYQITRDFSRS